MIFREAPYCRLDALLDNDKAFSTCNLATSRCASLSFHGQLERSQDQFFGDAPDEEALLDGILLLHPMQLLMCACCACLGKPSALMVPSCQANISCFFVRFENLACLCFFDCGY